MSQFVENPLLPAARYLDRPPGGTAKGAAYYDPDLDHR